MAGYKYPSARVVLSESTTPSHNAYEHIRSLLLKATEPFSRDHARGTPGKEVWCILRSPVVRYDTPGNEPFKTIDPLVWTPIPCHRTRSEPVLYVRQGATLVPIAFSTLWNVYLTDMQRAVLWLSVDTKNERRLANLLADNEREIARTFKEIGAPLPTLVVPLPSSPSKELAGV